MHLVMSASDTLVHIPRNAWKPSRFTAMESLPAEIGEQICPLLCLHCQNPESLPDAGSADVRFDKASLARLARTSKRMHGLVQPFVYHFYATGDLPWRIATGVSRDSKTYPSDDDKSTVVQRPDLAADVKALQLVESEDVRGCTADILPTAKPVSESMGLMLGLRVVEGWQKHGSAPITKSDARSRQLHRTNVGRSFEELQILLLPNLETLLVARDHACQYHHVDESGMEIPSLRIVALWPYEADYHVHKAMALFTASPRLETLYAISASSSYEQNVWTTDDPWALRLAGLRKLALTDLEPLDDLELLRGCCPSLSELHFSFVDHHDHWDAAHLMRALTAVKGQLRRSTLTRVPRNNDSDPEDPERAGVGKAA